MKGIDNDGRPKTIAITEGKKIKSADDLIRKKVKKIPELHTKDLNSNI
ncbi:MAG: hypothetical protein ACOCP4_04000 [Candidatus Woesearchaeota archaeon]